ncbi:MAG TPA: hypothetical protein VNN62_05205 [Methylomirabilota bacterium]|jgi:hypothetical protein|nr:hypothetical protein [Methylomirabilota bacterium]
MRCATVRPCLFFVAFLVWCGGSFAPPVSAQTGVGVGSSRPEHEGSRQPLKVKLSGFINTKPEEGGLGVIKLGIGVFRETYLFDLTNVEAVDRERVTPRAIFEAAEERDVAFDLTGPRNLLSKISQAPPGTPLAITGFIQQRERKMQVVDVQIIGFEGAAE